MILTKEEIQKRLEDDGPGGREWVTILRDLIAEWSALTDRFNTCYDTLDRRCEAGDEAVVTVAETGAEMDLLLVEWHFVSDCITLVVEWLNESGQPPDAATSDEEADPSAT